MLSLQAENSGTIGIKNFVFERPSVYSGTPATFNGTYLNFFVNDPNEPATSYYAMHIQEVGDNYDTAVPVQGLFSTDDSNGTDGFSISTDGFLTAKMTAVLQSFFACNTTSAITGQPILGLKWGVYQANDKAPEGCVGAQLKQMFNAQE